MIDTLLVTLSLVLLPFSVISAAILIRAARKRPRIGALTERAVIAGVITIMVVSGVSITINRVSGYNLFPIEVARAMFLASLVMLEFVPVGWCVLLLTRRLGNGGRG